MGGRSPKPFNELGPKRKEQLVKGAIELLQERFGSRAKEVTEAANKRMNPGRTNLEKQLLENISLYCREEDAGNKGRRAALLTKGLPLSLKEASDITGVSPSTISVAREKVNQGIFRITKVSSFLERKRERIEVMSL